MKYLKTLLLFFSITVLITGCEDTDDLLVDTGLSESDIIQGLKSALEVGVDTATNRLSATNGYYADAAVKLLLPPEVSNSLATFKNKEIDVFGLASFTGEDIYKTGIPGLVEPISSLEDDLILGINRAAESAANDAGPIFVSAITDITIADGNDILFGGVDTAATNYLENNTRTELFDEYEPKIDLALSSVKVGDKSVVSVYEDYVKKYNAILNTSVPTSLLSSSTIGSMMGVDAIAAENLSQYSTDKALTGLFKKVADEERLIRENPLNRVTDILSKVFGELD